MPFPPAQKVKGTFSIQSDLLGVFWGEEGGFEIDKEFALPLVSCLWLQALGLGRGFALARQRVDQPVPSWQRGLLLQPLGAGREWSLVTAHQEMHRLSPAETSSRTAPLATPLQPDPLFLLERGSLPGRGGQQQTSSASGSASSWGRLVVLVLP